MSDDVAEEIRGDFLDPLFFHFSRMENPISSHPQPVLRSNQVNENAIKDRRIFGSVDFPPLNDSHGSSRAHVVNPKIISSVQTGFDGVSGEKIQSSSDLVSHVAEENINGLTENSDISGIGTKEGNSNPSNWRGLFPMPKPIPSQSKLKFTPPVDCDGKMIVSASSDFFSAGIKSCEDLLVGFFVGNMSSFAAVQVAVTKLWEPKDKTVPIWVSIYGFHYIVELIWYDS